LPIIGAGKLSYLGDSLKAKDPQLTTEQPATPEKLIEISLGYPQQLLQRVQNM
jgi:hypothetical protein